MCTVTYIPLRDSFLLTSNRDENRNRPAAFPPSRHLVHGQRLLFPRDGLKGGTWIAAGENGYAMVLLNGAFEKHQPEPSYRLSRGLVLLDLLTAADPERAFNAATLTGIEPFTLIIAGCAKLVVGRWDGTTAIKEEPDPEKAHIWSSATLYPADVREKRAGWFKVWLEKNPQPDVPAVIAFHQFTGDGDSANDLRMERSNGIFTNSISLLDCSREAVAFHYLDLATQKSSFESLPFLTTSAALR